ncbi:pseudouridine synthase [Chitinophaga sp. LS1]|uniref:pseudouridine synthase n=1 Tax=Chitinophaga sp. LS1 TaxID=3051176 RepID=UPI002AAA9428|nr:pseudouridine synthase [Chitinophaga sp. LS1]WPV69118.1 pseudouridine synthase [Chitinophaga sp. LS1]
MKKNTPAKKGFSPFKENKSRAKGNDSRPAKRSATGGRPPRKENDGEFRPRKNDGEGFRGRKNDGEGFRPRKNDGEGFQARKNDGEGFRPRKNDGEGFRGRKSDDGEGFRPRKNDGEGFRGRKSDDGEGFRPRKNDGEGFHGRKSDDGEGFRPRKNDGEGFRGRKSDDGEGFRPRKNDGEGFRGRKSDDGEGFRPRKNDGEGFRGRKSDDGEGFRPRKNDGEGFRGRKSDERPARRPAGKDENGEPLPAFKKKEQTDGEDASRRNRIKPALKTANGRTPFKPKPGAKRDDSAFHGTDRGDRKGKDERETPSGFNRKKYFDNTNERFAARQERKTASRRDRKGSSTGSFGKKSDRDESGVAIEGEMPLNKYIAHCGLCSRRKAVDYVKEGKITVNGTVITEPAFKVTKKDEVTILGKKMHIQKNLVYILLNKPKGYITTTDDPEGRKTVMELIQDATEEERVYPVGRLDRNTSGLLLLTNDGELAQKLSHPKHNIRKIYHVGLNKPLTKAHFEAILAGVTLEDGVANVDVLGYVDNADKTQIGIEIHSGKNRIVRRIFEHLEYEVEKLDRVTYAGLTKKNINRGHWRYLTEKEIILLKHFK